MCQVGLDTLDAGHLGAQQRRKLGKYSHHLALLLVLQLTKLVIKLHDLYGLDIEGTPRGRLIVDEARNLTLVGRRNGNHCVAIAYGYHSIGIDNTRTLGPLQHLLQTLSHLTLVVAYGTTYRRQLLRCRRAHLAIIVDDTL